MPIQTVFWKHPETGEGCFRRTTATARDAAESAADYFASEDVKIEVWTGNHDERPPTEPDYSIG